MSSSNPSMLSIHATAMDSGNVVYHKFLLCFRDEGSLVYGIVEGRDDPSFYRGIIDRLLPEGWSAKLIRAGNKSRVLNAYSHFDWNRYSINRIGFFVDTDLSEFIPLTMRLSPNIYTTDKYSIDSELVTIHVFEQVIEDIFGITDMSAEESSKMRSLFEENFALFSNHMVPLMAQIIHWRRNGTDVVLDNIDLRGIFSFLNGRLVLNAGFSESIDFANYAATCVGATVSSPSTLAEIEVEFRTKDGPRKFIRGKYLLWLFLEFAKSVHNSASLFCSKLSAPPKIHGSIGLRSFVLLIAPRAQCPPSLKLFIESTFCEYIRMLTSTAGPAPSFLGS